MASPNNKPAAAADSAPSSSRDKLPVFPVGPAGKRELRRALVRSTVPARTIQTFQQEHSLHTMFSRAFGTTPSHEMKKTRSQEHQLQEPFDSESVMLFLSHLGVRQHEVHKRISDALMKQLETEIRKTQNTPALLELFKSCWAYAITLPELRPVLWAILKQLGEDTPLPVLRALAERDEEGELKHSEIFMPLPPLLKRLCWEADWESRIPPTESDSRTLQEYQLTLLYQTVEPLVDQYCNNQMLVDAANRLFVSTVRERRVLTKQRRALTMSTATTTNAGISGILRAPNAATGTELLDSGRAIAQLRTLLCDTVGTATTFRPKLLFALFSIIIAQHGLNTESNLGGAGNLRCSLVADVLLSAGGPLPRGYQDVVTLARLLDESVQEGDISDQAIEKIQTTLTSIFLSDDDAAASKKSKSSESAKSQHLQSSQEELSLATLRQLNKIITAGIEAMKDADPQNLFLNPVTDAIAPGYSKVITKPICIVQMEAKVSRNKYNSIDEWDKDVKLMFKNCVDYNRGPAGQWFRGEALRQGKVFRDEIFQQARRLFQTEVAKRSFVEEAEQRKRKALPDGPKIAPLPASAKKRKKDTKDEYLPSMPALASMLLADPFVVRILLARILRDLRRGVMNGTSIPAAHAVAPSLLQLLHLGRWSRQICAVFGKRYFVPDSGLQAIEEDNPAYVVPFATLRRYVPMLLRLFLEDELDRRMGNGGDLQAAAQAADFKVEPIPSELWAAGDQMEVSASLVQGALVFLCQPGLGNESSLAVTFPKFAHALQQLSSRLCDDHVFFLSLSAVLLRHKAKLPASTRDAVITSWLGWLRADARGAICTKAHEHLIRLLNDWSGFGNLIMPRDSLVQFTLESVRVVDSCAGPNGDTVARLWNKPETTTFALVKEQYERTLKFLPLAQAEQWKKDVGINSQSDGNAEGDILMNAES